MANIAVSAGYDTRERRARVALGRRERDRALLRPSSTRSGRSEFTGRETLTGRTVAYIGTDTGCRSRICADTRLHALRCHQPRAARNALEYGRQYQCRSGCDAEFTSRSSPRFAARWRTAKRNSQRYPIHAQRNIPRYSYCSGGDNRQQRRNCAAVAANPVHGSANQHTESKQPERQLKPSGVGSVIQRDGRDLVGNLTTAVVTVDAQLRVTFVNPAAEHLLGLSFRQMLGLTLAELLTPSEAIVRLCGRTVQTRAPFRLREFHCRVATKQLVINCRISPLENPAGVLLEFSDVSIDHRLRQESELIAQQKLSRIIVRQLAHEVKNPLGGMRGSAQLLQKQLPDENLARYTRVIITEVDRLAALVDSILQAGGKPVLAEINLHEVTEHVARLIEAEKPEGVTILRDYDPSLPELSADKNQLIQALLNVVRNAMQAVGDTGVLVIRTRALSNMTLGGQYYRLVLSIEVEDNGPGISEELLETIFYPLVTGRTCGTGLGLTISQDLVSRHHGLIEVTSEPGRTVFQIRLPVISSATTTEG